MEETRQHRLGDQEDLAGEAAAWLPRSFECLHLRAPLAGGQGGRDPSRQSGGGEAGRLKGESGGSRG
eukprot:12248760-Heterocapsa_arctica.AAC.1